ncbi:MAG: RNA polymerase sigma factor [Bacteroidales bacterium]
MQPNFEFEKIIEAYSPILLNKAYYLLSSKEDAEDLVQEVFYSAYANYHNYTGKGTSLSWLMGILYNKAMDIYKKRYRKGMKIHVNFAADFDKHGEWIHPDNAKCWGEDHADQEQLLDNLEFRSQFYGCIDALPERWRMIVIMCYLSEFKADYICSELGISTSNYWKLLQRSRLQLRKCIESKWFNI